MKDIQEWLDKPLKKKQRAHLMNRGDIEKNWEKFRLRQGWFHD